MMKYSFEELLHHSKLECKQLEQLYKAWCEDTPDMPLIDPEFLAQITAEFAVSQQTLAKLENAITAIEKDDRLLTLSLFFRDDMCAARHRCDMDDYKAMYPECLGEYADYYAFILLLSCIEPSIKRVRELGVPEAMYYDIPRSPLKKQLGKLENCKDAKVSDFPWDMNFYTCSIFLLDRFYFIPFRFDDEVCVYRNVSTHQNMAFFTDKRKIRTDGQLDGVNDIHQAQAFVSQYQISNGQLTANPISPFGYVENSVQTIELNEWECVLKKGDILLGLHIPSGEGYNPKRLSSSTKLAADFFRQYFSEIDFKGFGSESWLYDPHLRLVLNDKGNICAMQEQMYIYPIESGDEMLWHELFAGKKPLEELECKSSLQKQAVSFMREGGRFTASSMFILAQDIENIGVQMYQDAGKKQNELSHIAVKV